MVVRVEPARGHGVDHRFAALFRPEADQIPEQRLAPAPVGRIGGQAEEDARQASHGAGAGFVDPAFRQPKRARKQEPSAMTFKPSSPARWTAVSLSAPGCIQTNSTPARAASCFCAALR